MLNQVIIDLTYKNIFWPIRACETELINSLSKNQVNCLQKLIISTVNLCSLSVLCSFICLNVFVCVINHHTVSYNSFRCYRLIRRTFAFSFYWSSRCNNYWCLTFDPYFYLFSTILCNYMYFISKFSML